MPTFTVHSLILVALLSVAGVLLTGIDRSHVARSARWPLEEALYRVEGWAGGPAKVETAHGTTIVQRTFRPAQGPDVTFILTTSPQAKAIYGAGAELPFLGSGYTAAPVALDVAVGGGVSAQVARRGEDAWLIYSARGERRGLIDGGARRWGLVALDAIMGRPNDYYRVAVIVPVDAKAVPGSPTTAILAETLFGRVAGWYGIDVAPPSTHSQLLTNSGLLGN